MPAPLFTLILHTKRGIYLFIENMVTAAQQVLILYIMIAVGFICDKTGLYQEKAARMTNDLLFYIVTPAIITQSFLSMELTKENATALLISAVCGFAMHGAAILISLPFFRKGNREENAVYQYASVYGNVGYMALPMAQALLGAPGVFYCSACLIPFNVVCFTHGVAVMSGGTHFNWKKLLFNPGTISVAIGLPLYLLEVKLPAVLADPISFIAGLNTPMAMIMFGTYLANTDLKTMFREKKIYLAAILKLLVLPSLMLLIFRLCGISGALLTACIISASAPTANNTVMFAAKYGRDTGLASKTVAVITFLSILTMPLMIALSATV